MKSLFKHKIILFSNKIILSNMKSYYVSLLYALFFFFFSLFFFLFVLSLLHLDSCVLSIVSFEFTYVLLCCLFHQIKIINLPSGLLARLTSTAPSPTKGSSRRLRSELAKDFTASSPTCSTTRKSRKALATKRNGTPTSSCTKRIRMATCT